MRAQESVMRAAGAGMVPAARRGTAYGLFNTYYGMFRFVGSALMGFLYDISIPYLVAFAITAQPALIPLLLKVKRHSGSRELAG